MSAQFEYGYRTPQGASEAMKAAAHRAVAQAAIDARQVADTVPARAQAPDTNIRPEHPAQAPPAGEAGAQSGSPGRGLVPPDPGVVAFATAARPRREALIERAVAMAEWLLAVHPDIGRVLPLCWVKHDAALLEISALERYHHGAHRFDPKKPNYQGPVQWLNQLAVTIERLRHDGTLRACTREEHKPRRAEAPDVAEARRAHYDRPFTPAWAWPPYDDTGAPIGAEPTPQAPAGQENTDRPARLGENEG